MVEADDEYERERQDNIRKNQELLLSLGLSATKSRENAAAAAKERRRRVEAQRRESAEASSGSGSGSSPSPQRSSSRLSSRPRKSYAPKKRSSLTENRPVYREGTRKSARLSDPGHVRSNFKDNGEDLIIERISRRPPISTLKRLQNPMPPRREAEEVEEREYESAPLPTRDDNGNIIFENNCRHFQPNVTPEEMLRGGIFGGTAFRPFFSSVTGRQLSSEEDLSEFPQDWYSGLDKETQLMSTYFDPSKNRFGVKAGQTLEEWEQNGWIRRQDPRGWWQWYFRFYLGRRTSDDARQISRFLKACGPSGRFKRSLVSKIHYAGAKFDDETISPVVRQTLFHWAYALTETDYHAYLP